MGEASNSAPRLSMPVNQSNQHGTIALRVPEWHTYLGSYQQLSLSGLKVSSAGQITPGAGNPASKVTDLGGDAVTATFPSLNSILGIFL